MPRNPAPVRPLVKHSKAYDRAINSAYLRPLFNHLREGLAEASALGQVYRAMDAAIEATAVKGVPIALIRKHLARIDAYHKMRVIQSFRAALGVDVSILLADPAIRAFMTVRIEENVALIKTIPPRMHASLRKRITKEFTDRPFDRQAVMRLFRDEYDSSGYNLRRLTRDQASKLSGQLTEQRQRQLGVQGYRWKTAGDKAVRPTHKANNELLFRWADPPVLTGHPGHDVQCRCLALPILLKADRERLKALPKALA